MIKTSPGGPTGGLWLLTTGPPLCSGAGLSGCYGYITHFLSVGPACLGNCFKCEERLFSDVR